MKRTFALLLSVLLALSLTACGKDKNNAAANSAGSSVTDRGDGALDGGAGSGTVTGDAIAPGTNDALPGDPLPGDSAAEVAPDDHLNGTDYGSAGAVPQSRVHGASYDQMLRNARVHDRDGYLPDGENAVTPGAMPATMY